MNPMLAFLNMWEVIAVLAVFMLIYGARKLPELAKGLGQGIKEFKKASVETPAESKQQQRS